ncbi:MAG: ABC transporter permease [Candidatus Methanosuratincola sp.]|uniref:Multidrug ABC transporter permease n=1 Tax=Methanosuratincola subterraneus TaxID=2593994 RepID=A0A3S3RNX8_METS7|nr:MAG: multidrug ABC transporter permease [Candidatus Methanosuratincola subterraneus]
MSDLTTAEANKNLVQPAGGIPAPGDKSNSTIISSSPYHGLWALTNRELKKWYKNPVILLLSLIQPVLWLGLFGKAMNFGAIFTDGAFSIPGLNIPKEIINQLGTMLMLNVFGTTDYFSFLAVGMLSFIVLFTAMFSGMSIVWDRRLGTLNKVMSTPVARGSIVMSKILSSVIRSLVQASIILVLAVLLGMNISNITAIGVLGTFASLALLSFGFSAIFLMLALRSTNQNTQMAVVNLLNLPLLFGSNALFPASFMPEWLQAFVKINPISYATDIGRQMLLGAGGMGTLAFDFAYLTAFAAAFSIVGIMLSWRLLTK